MSRFWWSAIVRRLRALDLTISRWHAQRAGSADPTQPSNFLKLTARVRIVAAPSRRIHANSTLPGTFITPTLRSKLCSARSVARRLARYCFGSSIYPRVPSAIKKTSVTVHWSNPMPIPWPRSPHRDFGSYLQYGCDFCGDANNMSVPR